MSEKLPQVYNLPTDELVDVTQKWCDDIQLSVNKLALQRDVIQRILKINIVKEHEKLTKISQFLLTLEL